MTDLIFIAALVVLGGIIGLQVAGRIASWWVGILEDDEPVEPPFTL